MRRIKIDESLTKQIDQFCTNLFVHTRNANFTRPIELLKRLKSTVPGYNKVKRQLYIQHIIDNYERIIKAKPKEIPTLITEFESILPYAQFEKPGQKPPKLENRFYHQIVTAMRYEDLREKEFPNIIQSLGIKSCVYCNALLTVVIDLEPKMKKGKVIDYSRKANLELDHFYPKSKYPFLSTSIYNLYPTCSNCNKSKSIKDSKFQLYTEDDNLEVFKFSLTDDSIFNYWKDHDPNLIEIEFESYEGDKELLDNHMELFSIQQIYNTQKDIAEELLHKSLVYSDAYKKSLIKNYESLFPDKTMINRLIIGNYDKPELIHRRPMAKFTYDIAKQLKLI